jgi:hypothetical protein
MEVDWDGALAEPPAGFRWHDTAAFGFAVAVPRRFQRLANTVDPVAQEVRSTTLAPQAGRRQCEEPQAWPDGLWDPEVLGDVPGGPVQPFRILEFDAIGLQAEPLSRRVESDMWFQARQVFPKTLESEGLPGYALLDINDQTLGDLDALGFEYRWDGLRHNEDGGDHVLFVWAPSPLIVFHVYYHCCQTEWAARTAEFEAILATFRVIEPPR